MDMSMRSAVPDWLTPVAWTYITVSLLSVALIALDIYVLRRRHRSVATELVWLTSALYLGPFAVVAYLRRGRAHPATNKVALGMAEPADGRAVAVLPGGGASAVAHLIAVPLVVAVGWTVAGLAMWPMILVIAVLATVMLAIYERAASRDQRAGRVHRISVGAAFVGAVITVAAFDVGMVGWMLLLHFNDLMPPVTEGTFWFLMQIGVVVGLLTGYPAVMWLLRRNRSVVPA
ncbi:DUF4396 domain-containing protein [Nocardioides zhouii]|uniref:DUF4396 domain-containing protein n=1 Tax=Nocardioides zhouii TaxID=1168729 RepID=A0A4V1RNW6_9ACTN|nr:DUF4396 domain-containing protein [Nocardioides zhouii]RYC07287.1 DUF4396 domain-containing protein [Nocardioides zhouii]